MGNSKRTQQKNTSTKVETKSNTSRPTPSKSTFTPVSFGVFSLDQLVEKEKPNNNEETKKEEPKKSPLQTTQTKPIPSNTTKPKPTINPIQKKQEITKQNTTKIEPTTSKPKNSTF